jgi:ABC-type Zn uptake system ZnuABC Zn-binding protein ZnuA
VTTTTDLRSLVEAVGGDRVEAISLVPAAMDAEEYQPKPQDLLRLKHARLLVRVGLDYDLWLDRLLAQTDNPDVRRGSAGYVDASIGIPVLEVRGMSVGSNDGHAHGNGNPHYWLDPRNAEIITRVRARARQRLRWTGSSTLLALALLVTPALWWRISAGARVLGSKIRPG